MNFTGIRRGLHRHRMRISPVNFTKFPRVAEIIYSATRTSYSRNSATSGSPDKADYRVLEGLARRGLAVDSSFQHIIPNEERLRSLWEGRFR
ncbi:hypothetical protein WMF01_10305 [Sorangium sp. So ce1667]